MSDRPDDVIELADRLWNGEISRGSTAPGRLQGKPRRDLERGRIHPVFRQRFGVRHGRRTRLRRHRVCVHGGFDPRTDPQVVLEPARHGDLLPRSHRPRLRGSGLRKRGGGARLAPSCRRGPRSSPAALRPLHADRRVQRSHQRAAVPGARARSGRPSTGTRTAPTRIVSTSRWAGSMFELHHAKGETDDHTWTWVLEHRVLCCGDLFIWASPNCGQPPEGPAFPERVGRGTARDGRARPRGPPAGPRLSRHRSRPRPHKL